MDRQEEIQTINEHISTQGAYQCKMGECFYGDDGPSYRERASNMAKSRTRIKKQETIRPCEFCGVSFSFQASKNQKYCSRPCYSGATKGTTRTPYTAKEITIAGHKYSSRVGASKALGVSTGAIQRMIKRGTAI